MSILTHNFTTEFDSAGRRIVPINSRPVALSCSISVFTTGYDPALRMPNDWKKQAMDQMTAEFNAYLSEVLDEAEKIMQEDTPPLGIGNLINLFRPSETDRTIGLEITVSGMVAGFIYVDNSNGSIVYEKSDDDSKSIILDASFVDDTYSIVPPNDSLDTTTVAIDHCANRILTELYKAIFFKDDSYSEWQGLMWALDKKKSAHLNYIAAKYLEVVYSNATALGSRSNNADNILDGIKTYNKRWTIIPQGSIISAPDASIAYMDRTLYNTPRFQVDDVHMLGIFEPMPRDIWNSNNAYRYWLTRSKDTINTGLAFVRGINHLTDPNKREILGYVRQVKLSEYPEIVYSAIGKSSTISLLNASMIPEDKIEKDQAENLMRKIMKPICDFHGLDNHIVMRQIMGYGYSDIILYIRHCAKSILEARSLENESGTDVNTESYDNKE